METDFKEPTLKLHRLIHSAYTLNEIEPLRKHLVESNNAVLYKRLIESKLLQNSPEDLKKIQKSSEEKISEMIALKEKDPENESHINEVNKKICEFYAQTCDLENLKSLSTELMKTDSSMSLKMDIYMCFIRIAIIMGDRNMLFTNIEKANDIFDSTCDWDRKNRFKVYLGLYNLMKTNFKHAVEYFAESLASFEAKELLSFDEVVFYLIFSSLLSCSRPEIKTFILENSEVQKSSVSLKLVESFYNCKYERIFKDLITFIEIFENDAFIGPFREHFCKEMKLKSYNQLLKSYRSLHIDRMASVFGVTQENLEEDLANFINEGKLHCVIDRISGIVRVTETEGTSDTEYLAKRGDVILKNIKKAIN